MTGRQIYLWFRKWQRDYLKMEIAGCKLHGLYGAMEPVSLVLAILLSPEIFYSTFHTQAKFAGPFFTHTHSFIHAPSWLSSLTSFVHNWSTQWWSIARTTLPLRSATSIPSSLPLQSCVILFRLAWEFFLLPPKLSSYQTYFSKMQNSSRTLSHFPSFQRLPNIYDSATQQTVGGYSAPELSSVGLLATRSYGAHQELLVKLRNWIHILKL